MRSSAIVAARIVAQRRLPLQGSRVVSRGLANEWHPTRRRSRRQKAPEAPRELNAEEWSVAAEACLAHITKGFEEAVQMNPGAGIATDDEGTHIDFGEGRGVLSLSINRNARTLDVLSPVSGALQYSYDASARSWLHVKDRHDVLGIIVRDFLRSGCVGLPKM